MSDVNKLDSKQCPFDPEQYKIDTLAAPVGTSPWALIQVYLGNKVHRKDWCAPDEYIHLVSDSDAPEIKKRDKHGVMTSWQPTQEDLMACDWDLFKSEPKPDDCIVEFDLEVGHHLNDTWGYAGYTAVYPFIYGKLTNLKNEIGIQRIYVFNFDINSMSLIFYNNYNAGLGDIIKKNLYVTVNHHKYNLGSFSRRYGLEDSDISIVYDSDEALNLGALLQQNVGNTLHFSLNWK